MQIISVEAREIHVDMQLSITEIRSILTCMDNCVLELDMNNEDHKRAEADFMRFYKFLNEFNERIGNGRVDQTGI
jgi:hypothetical protein